MSGINGQGSWRKLGALALDVKCFNCHVKFTQDISEDRLKGKHFSRFDCSHCGQPYWYCFKTGQLEALSAENLEGIPHVSMRL